MLTYVMMTTLETFIVLSSKLLVGQRSCLHPQRLPLFPNDQASQREVGISFLLAASLPDTICRIMLVQHDRVRVCYMQNCACRRDVILPKHITRVSDHLRFRQNCSARYTQSEICPFAPLLTGVGAEVESAAGAWGRGCAAGSAAGTTGPSGSGTGPTVLRGGRQWQGGVQRRRLRVRVRRGSSGCSHWRGRRRPRQRRGRVGAAEAGAQGRVGAGGGAAQFVGGPPARHPPEARQAVVSQPPSLLSQGLLT